MRQQEMENKEPMDQSPEETVEAPAPEAAEAQEPTPEEEAPQPAGEAENLQEALREKEDQYLRLLAEYDNYRKRSQKEKETCLGHRQGGDHQGTPSRLRQPGACPEAGDLRRGLRQRASR